MHLEVCHRGKGYRFGKWVCNGISSFEGWLCCAGMLVSDKTNSYVDQRLDNCGVVTGFTFARYLGINHNVRFSPRQWQVENITVYTATEIESVLGNSLLNFKTTYDLGECLVLPNRNNSF